MKRDLALFKEAVEDALSVAAAVKTWATRVGDGVVLLNTKRVIELEELVGDGLHRWPKTMAVHSIAVRTSGNS